LLLKDESVSSFSVVPKNEENNIQMDRTREREFLAQDPRSSTITRFGSDIKELPNTPRIWTKREDVITCFQNDQTEI
jgi:hypothetical protein